MRRAVVTGGAGFVGSHVCEALLADGFEVICFDSLITGRMANLSDCVADPAMRVVEQDVTEPIRVDGKLDWVLHLASPASPPDYLRLPIETLRVGSAGTHRALELAREKGARFLLASTSEVYGDPEVHPQPETYWGNVNPIGPRSVYDEAKRYAEALTMAYKRSHGLRTKIIRIFNTYGPRMRADDGRAVPTFVARALRGDPITVHGTGRQTRSLCHVDDLVLGIRSFMEAGGSGPMNLGNPNEVTILELAELVRSLAGSSSEIVFTKRPQDDPEMRCPDISLARETIDWEPKVSLADGLTRTIDWARLAWATSS